MVIVPERDETEVEPIDMGLDSSPVLHKVDPPPPPYERMFQQLRLLRRRGRPKVLPLLKKCRVKYVAK